MAKGGNAVLRLSPEPWLGVTTDFNPKFTEELKKLVDVKAWDRSTYTWWMPSQLMPHVLTLMREHKVASDNEIEHARRAIEIERRPKFAPTSETFALYAELGLHPSAPPMLVEWAVYFWRKQSESIGAPTTKLLQVEEAYRKICAGAQGGITP